MEASGIRFILHGSRTDEITIWNLSDLHWGARALGGNFRQLPENLRSRCNHVRRTERLPASEFRRSLGPYQAGDKRDGGGNLTESP